MCHLHRNRKYTLFCSYDNKNAICYAGFYFFSDKHVILVNFWWFLCFLTLVKLFENFLGDQKIENLRNVFLSTRWQRNANFRKYNSFLWSNNKIQRFFNKVEVTVLEKHEVEKEPFTIFDLIFWPLGGVKWNFWPSQIVSWVLLS